MAGIIKLLTGPDSGKKPKIRSLNFFLHSEGANWMWGNRDFLKKGKLVLYLCKSFFFSSRRFSPGLQSEHYKKVVFNFVLLLAKYSLRRILMLLPPRSVGLVTFCLNSCKSLARVWFFNLGQVFKSIMGTDEWVSESVDQGKMYKLLFEA